MNVANIDAVERRIHQVQDGERGGDPRVEAGTCVRVHGDRARREQHRLREQQGDRTRPQPGERREGVEDRLEVVGPATHALGGDEHRDLCEHGTTAVDDVPQHLHGLAEIEGVAAQRDVASHDDGSHREQISEDGDAHHAPRSHRGDPIWGQERASPHDDGEGDDEVLGARQGEATHRAAARHEHDDRRGRNRHGDAVERAHRVAHGGRR